MDSRAVAAAFLTSGVTHLVRPQVFLPLIPKALPAPKTIVYASGVAELVCAAGLLTKQRWAGPASAAVLIGVLPGNVQLALDTTRAARRRPTPKRVAVAVAAWSRLPGQIPLIKAVLRDR
jgi:uncharacterized membrane protein